MPRKAKEFSCGAPGAAPQASSSQGKISSSICEGRALEVGQVGCSAKSPAIILDQYPSITWKAAKEVLHLGWRWSYPLSVGRLPPGSFAGGLRRRFRSSSWGRCGDLPAEGGAPATPCRPGGKLSPSVCVIDCHAGPSAVCRCRATKHNIAPGSTRRAVSRRSLQEQVTRALCQKVDIDLLAAPCASPQALPKWFT